jgi:1,4-dihydroxy-6-naphthoate synthase
MVPPSVTEIVCAHSPDSDDAFMFYGLATKKVRSTVVNFRHVLEDIETLNRKARIRWLLRKSRARGSPSQVR